MIKDKFRAVLMKATASDVEALSDIVELYMPLINRYSYIGGKLDEDLRQEILIELFKSIPRFKI